MYLFPLLSKKKKTGYIWQHKQQTAMEILIPFKTCIELAITVAEMFRF